MPLSEKMDQEIVDMTVNPYLETIYNSLPKENAIAALAMLAGLSMMNKRAQAYPPLPMLFQDEIYQRSSCRHLRS